MSFYPQSFVDLPLLLIKLMPLCCRPSNTSDIVYVSQSHTFYGTIAYRGPSIDFVSPLELSSIGGTEMTVDGSDFGFEFLSTVSIFVCNQPCMRATFASSTSVTCNAPPAPQANYKLLAPVADIYCVVTISVANQNGTFEGNVTFVRPPLSLQSVSPQIAGSGMIVTFIGAAFGLANSNPIVRIGFTACAVTLWQSWTQLLCYVSPGSGKALSVSVTIFDRSVSILSSYSYLPPEIRSVVPRSIPSPGSIITVSGSNFGTNQSRIAVYTNELPCTSPLLITSNILTCLAAAGSGVNRMVSVFSDDQSSTTGTINYNPPSLDSVYPALLPANLGFQVTVIGTSLGFAASAFLLLNFSIEIWPFPILSGCYLESPHVALVCSVSTSPFPSEKTANGAVNLSVSVSVDAQASGVLPVAILPRSSLARLTLIFDVQFSSRVFSGKLIGLLSAPPSCSIFIRNVSATSADRRLLTSSVVMDLYVLSHRSDSEAQKFMDDLGAMWSSNPKPLQVIGVIGATFENVIPIFSPTGKPLPAARDEATRNNLPDWFVPAISVIMGAIVFGMISFFVFRYYRAESLASTDKTTSSINSESSELEDGDEDQNQNNLISIQIDDNSHVAEEETRMDSEGAGVGAHALRLDPKNHNKNKIFGVLIDRLVTRQYRGYSIPLIAATLMDFVSDMDGQNTQGIFRLSASVKEIDAARRQFEVCGMRSRLCSFLMSALVSWS